MLSPVLLIMFPPFKTPSCTHGCLLRLLAGLGTTWRCCLALRSRVCGQECPVIICVHTHHLDRVCFISRRSTLYLAFPPLEFCLATSELDLIFRANSHWQPAACTTHSRNSGTDTARRCVSQLLSVLWLHMSPYSSRYPELAHLWLRALLSPFRLQLNIFHIFVYLAFCLFAVWTHQHKWDDFLWEV